MTLAHDLDPEGGRPRPEVCATMRIATQAAHEKLEQSLALLSRVPDRQWFRDVLVRFLGFHEVWERAIARRPHMAGFMESRARVPHLRRDLAALGFTTAELDRAPRCEAAATLVEAHHEAIGSIYVMEGSTLGGQVISRALAQAPWLPAGGLTYFHPHGRRTGEMWRSFRAWADEQTAPAGHPAAVAGAERTFTLLREWLVP